MKTEERHETDHEHAQELIPWWVNGRLSRADAARLETHFKECEECRMEAELQREVQATMRQATSIEYAPQASFQKLWSRIEELEMEVPSGRSGYAPRSGAPPPGDRPAFTGWRMAAAFALTLGLGALAASSWQAAGLRPNAEFRTASSPGAELHARVSVRAVFSGATTLDELTGIMRGSGLTIVSGPTESGVYSLALTDEARSGLDTALARLRADPRVRFAEPVDAGATTRQ